MSIQSITDCCLTRTVTGRTSTYIASRRAQTVRLKRFDIFLIRNGAGVNHFPRYRHVAKKIPIDRIPMPYTALQAAAEGGCESLVRLFCAPEYGLLKSGKEYSNAILAAARGGHEAIVEYLMQQGTEFDISELRLCILQEALWNGNSQLASAMLDGMQELTSTIILAGWCFHQIFPPLKGVTGLFDCYSQEELVWRTGLRHSAVLLSQDRFKERI